MQLLRKISVRTVFGDKADVLEMVLKEKDKAHPVMRVVGIANGTKSGKQKDDENREWKALLGNFEATSLKTGEVYRSGVCFLPDFAIETVAGQLNDEVDSVRFAFDVFASYDADAATSYVYDVKPLIQPSEGDPLNALAAALPAVQPVAALSAPAKGDKKGSA